MPYRIEVVSLQSIQDIPHDVTALRLHCSNINEISVADLVAFFEAIPLRVTTLDISWHMLASGKTTEQMVALFAAIPRHLINLNIDANGLGFKSAPDLVTILAALPQGLHTLDLGPIRYRKTAEDIVTMLNVLPPDLTVLNLSNNGFFRDSTEELSAIFNALPRRLLNLNISRNSLALKSATDLVTILAALPQGLHTLDLGPIRNMKTAADMVTMLNALPPDLTSLNLNSNGFSTDSTAELSAIFNALPRNLTSFDMHSCELGSKTAGQIITVLKLLPRGLNTLNLSRNHLAQKSVADLVAIFRAIPPEVNTLDISDDELYAKSAADLVTLFAAMPPAVSALQIQPIHSAHIGNTLTTTAKLIKLLSALPEQITEVTLDWMDIRDRTPEELISLGQALPHVAVIHVLNAPPNHPSLNILKSNMGLRVRIRVQEIYRVLIEENMAADLALIVLEKETGQSQEEILRFLNEPLPSPRPEPEPENDCCCFSFQLSCLDALAIVGKVALVVGVVALFFVAPIVALSAVVLMSLHGLFSRPNNSDIPAVPVDAQNHLVLGG